MNKQLIILTTLLLALCSQLIQAQIPRTLSYQGVLTDSLGNPKPDNTYNLTFRLYDGTVGGNILWIEAKSLQVKRGLFATILGDQTPFSDSLKFDKPYWLSLQVASEAELSPRIPLTAVGYSLYSIKSDTAKFAASAPQQLFVDSSRIAATVPENSITGNKIANSQVVRSINNKNDNLTLAGQGGATITSSGDTIYINAGGGGDSSGIFGIQNTDNTIDVINPNGPTATVNVKSGVFLPITGGTLTGAITSTGNPSITMGKGNFGSGNTNSGTNAFVTGQNNTASGLNSVISGGINNTANIDRASVGGGINNTASGLSSRVGGGEANTASGTTSIVSGGLGNNSIAQSATISGGENNSVTAVGATIGGGSLNHARGSYSVVSGGGGAIFSDSNAASGNYSTISGGRGNKSSGHNSTIGGGWGNIASELFSTVSGGMSNYATGEASAISGGTHNFAGNEYAGVSSGYSNYASGWGANVGGGAMNSASGQEATVSGGAHNTASGENSTASGGQYNSARGDYAVVSGGGGVALDDSNSASGDYSTIGGGSYNSALGMMSTIGGGKRNTASTSGSTVAGGFGNDAIGYESTVGGGGGNIASGERSIVCGGLNNRAIGSYSVVSGGGGTVVMADTNSAVGDYSTIPGGRSNLAQGTYSFAAGRRAKALHNGSFVWGDAANSDVESDTTNQFKIRASNGLNLASNANTAKPIRIGDHYRDNAIIAWAKVYSSGTIDNDFGIISVVRNSAGNYTITINATTTGADALIPIAVPEIDTAPNSAATARIVSINQQSTTTFDVYILNGSWTPTDNDFTVIVTGR